MLNRLNFLVVLVIIFILAGCMSPQYFRERRIASFQDTFDSFSPEIQQKVRQGQIDIGFNQDMVLIAWGRADRTYTRITDDGVAKVWAYTRKRIRTETERMSVPVRESTRSGKTVIRYRSVWIDKDTEEEYTAARVEFIDGMVSAIEQLNQ
ncbi:MAG: hypothetical protein KQH63_13525 [Desulfobulbaceae bacterium]|nr:hypothetical protein [Desulfobulbaceae bacterium]